MAIPDENLFQKLKFDEERQHQHQSGSSKIIDPWNEQVIDSCDEQARRHEQAGTHEQAQRKRLRSPTIDDSDSSKRRKAHDNENRNFGHSSFKISNDLDSKSAPEAVWKAIEWLVRLKFSWLDHTVADSSFTSMQIKTHYVVIAVA